MIEVRAIDERTLVVKALAKNAVIREDSFVEGKDFSLSSGRIKLKRQVHLSLAYPSGNPFIGPAYEEEELGLDEKGQGKYRQKAGFAGTAFLIIPVVGSGTDDTRFVKISE